MLMTFVRILGFAMLGGLILTLVVGRSQGVLFWKDGLLDRFYIWYVGRSKKPKNPDSSGGGDGGA